MEVYDIVRGDYPQPDKILSRRESLIEGLLYYYWMWNKYGIHVEYLPKICQSQIPTIQPAILFGSETGYDDLKIFIQQNFNWFVEQAEQLLPFTNVVQRYIDRGYERMNSICRSESKILFVNETKLIHAFNFASPLPRDLLVFRTMTGFSYSLTDVSVEKGFMSTSIAYMDQKMRARERSKHYLLLFLPRELSV